MTTNHLPITDATFPILADAMTRPDPLMRDAIVALLETGTIHTPAANLLNRDDRRNLIVLRNYLDIR